MCDWNDPEEDIDVKFGLPRDEESPKASPLPGVFSTPIVKKSTGGTSNQTLAGMRGVISRMRRPEGATPLFPLPCVSLSWLPLSRLHPCPPLEAQSDVSDLSLPDAPSHAPSEAGSQIPSDGTIASLEDLKGVEFGDGSYGGGGYWERDAQNEIERARGSARGYIQQLYATLSVTPALADFDLSAPVILTIFHRSGWHDGSNAGSCQRRRTWISPSPCCSMGPTPSANNDPNTNFHPIVRRTEGETEKNTKNTLEAAGMVMVNDTNNTQTYMDLAHPDRLAIVITHIHHDHIMLGTPHPTRPEPNPSSGVRSCAAFEGNVEDGATKFWTAKKPKLEKAGILKPEGGKGSRDTGRDPEDSAETVQREIGKGRGSISTAPTQEDTFSLQAKGRLQKSDFSRNLSSTDIGAEGVQRACQRVRNFDSPEFLRRKVLEEIAIDVHSCLWGEGCAWFGKGETAGKEAKVSEEDRFLLADANQNPYSGVFNDPAVLKQDDIWYYRREEDRDKASSLRLQRKLPCVRKELVDGPTEAERRDGEDWSASSAKLLRMFEQVQEKVGEVCALLSGEGRVHEDFHPIFIRTSSPQTGMFSCQKECKCICCRCPLVKGQVTVKAPIGHKDKKGNCLPLPSCGHPPEGTEAKPNKFKQSVQVPYYNIHFHGLAPQPDPMPLGIPQLTLPDPLYSPTSPMIPATPTHAAALLLANTLRVPVRGDDASSGKGQKSEARPAPTRFASAVSDRGRELAGVVSDRAPRGRPLVGTRVALPPPVLAVVGPEWWVYRHEGARTRWRPSSNGRERGPGCGPPTVRGWSGTSSSSSVMWELSSMATLGASRGGDVVGASGSLPSRAAWRRASRWGPSSGG
uniref:Uncharacterized protein n=1 Tax=Chromera velia CCMP2878 TaxID=1169474 RepID=A0A0G4F060_9ALVE|eukprot:Cvel_2584.t1-p1 / transcript=Cvel_2584.t1 / gene=Cvel_2584 / organism=Chromera_velia_CCMP2878 / gene_product=hypothetical protein / transcript_product=hypothetical protein / location=Cvel_scaffold102:79952-87687(+) / protein_length=856 / sequence_SO=supercontig / SO=protein_coding / is_pseudo=false